MNDPNETSVGARFRALHSATPFLIPNPWDAGSARLLQGLGFAALATTSSGFAMTLGRGDGDVSKKEKLDHCRLLCSVTSIPVSADLEHGLADDPTGVGETIREFAAAGVAGGSIEDYSRERLYDFDEAVERIEAAAAAARSLDDDFVLTARAEQLLRGSYDLDAVTSRLQAFAAAGADVLYAPGLRTLDDVQRVAEACDRPLNVLASMLPGVPLREIAGAGAQRISVGGGFAWVAYGEFARRAEAARDSGLLDLKPARTAGELIGLLGEG